MRHYTHTNKWGFIDQLVHTDTIEAVHKQMNDELAMAEGNAPATQPKYADQDRGKMVDETLGQQYHIAEDQANKIYLPEYVKSTDPAFKVIQTVAKHMNA
jgi:hypothetical protein